MNYLNYILAYVRAFIAVCRFYCLGDSNLPFSELNVSYILYNDECVISETDLTDQTDAGVTFIILVLRF
jgi:hypothetical protein